MEKERNWSSKIYILFALFVMVGVICIQLYDSFQEYTHRQEEVEELKQKISAENERNLKLIEQEKYTKSDEYIEDKAREEFNLIKDGEEVYILKKE